MAETLDLQQYSISLGNTINNPADLQSPVQAVMNIARSFGWTTGTGAGQADRIFADTRTLTASSTEDLDLAGGPLVDAVGVAFTLARIKLLYVAAAVANANNVVIGGVANGLAGPLSPAASGLCTIQPGGVALFIAGVGATGYVVTPATGDLLHVANGGAGTSVTYDVVVIGCSA